MTSELSTIAECSDFVNTGRSDEVERLCLAYAVNWPRAVRSFEYGVSAEGRSMQAMLITRTGAHTPDEAMRREIPVLMIQGGIHPGESDGKDAGFIAVREMLQGAAAPGALERIALLFVPAFNVDGHERFKNWHRPNQRGPRECGWRTTAQNLNLNRDYAKAEAPEMQAMLGLLRQWEPLICADLHVTDGADFEPDVSIQVEPINQGDRPLRSIGVELRDDLIDRLSKQGSIPLPFYPDLARVDDPTSGFVLSVYSPRFSTGYFPQRNRFTVLVETHSWKPYAHRVRVTRNSIVELAQMTAAHGARWLAAARAADARALQSPGEPFELDFESSWREPTGPVADASGAQADLIDFRGYAYTRLESAISADRVTAYDPQTPAIWRVPLRQNVEASLVVRAPGAGYAVPAGFSAPIGAKLAAHGIRFTSLSTACERVAVETFRATEVRIATGLFEGRTRLSLHGEWQGETMTIPPRSLFVPIAQPLARLVMALLEPKAPDSFAAWGFFNACFEQKEHLEPYVAEQIARQMLEADAALRAQFERRLGQDAAFAANPAARLDFFLRRHESWDERYNLYPVMRLERAP
jgi:Zinc carboxypeptidase